MSDSIDTTNAALADTNNNLSLKIMNSSGINECIMRVYNVTGYTSTSGIITVQLDSIPGYSLESVMSQLSHTDTIFLPATAINSENTISIRCKKLSDGSDYTGTISSAAIRIFAIYKMST